MGKKLVPRMHKQANLDTQSSHISVMENKVHQDPLLYTSMPHTVNGSHSS